MFMKHKELFYHYDKIVQKLKENKDVVSKEHDINKHMISLSDIGREMLYTSFIYLSEIYNDVHMESLVLDSSVNETDNLIKNSLQYFMDSDKGRFKICLVESYEKVDLNKYQSKTKNELKLSLIKLGNTDKDTFQNKDAIVGEYIIYSNMFDINDCNVEDMSYEVLKYLNTNIIYDMLYKDVKYKGEFDYSEQVLHAQQEDYLNMFRQ